MIWKNLEDEQPDENEIVWMLRKFVGDGATIVRVIYYQGNFWKDYAKMFYRGPTQDYWCHYNELPIPKEME